MGYNKHVPAAINRQYERFLEFEKRLVGSIGKEKMTDPSVPSLKEEKVVPTGTSVWNTRKHQAQAKPQGGVYCTRSGTVEIELKS